MFRLYESFPVWRQVLVAGHFLERILLVGRARLYEISCDVDKAAYNV